MGLSRSDISPCDAEFVQAHLCQVPTLPPKATQQTETIPEPPKSRYRYVIRQWDQSTGSQVDSDRVPIKKEPETSKDVAFVFRRVMGKDGGIRDAKSEMDIEGPELRDILKDCIGTDYWQHRSNVVEIFCHRSWT